MAFQPPLLNPPDGFSAIEAERRQMDTDQKAKHQPGAVGGGGGGPLRWTN